MNIHSFKTALFAVLLLSLNQESSAQNTIASILQTIEQNNTTLQSLKQQAEATKLGNKTGIYLENPELEWGKLWGSPTTIGNRVDLGIKQRIDFPTAYHYKTQLAAQKNQQIALQYESQRKQLLLMATLFCSDWIYKLKQKEALSIRLEQAKELAQAYQTRFDRGDVSVLERNKAQLNLLTAQKEIDVVEIELTSIESEIQRLNGGIEIAAPVIEYPHYALTKEIDQWVEYALQNNPSIQYATQEVVVSEKQTSLLKALNLPKITAGYTSERILGTTLQGVSVGVSIPLWENKNRVKQQKAQTKALQQAAFDVKHQVREQLKNQYQSALSLQKLLHTYSTILESVNNQTLLKSALDKGQLSLISYLMELGIYNQAIADYLELEWQFQIKVATLKQWDKQ